MSYSSYPAINYRPKKDWQRQPYLDPLSTEMEGGNSRSRSRPGDDVAVVTQTVQMTTSEYSTFETFVKTTLNRGASRFTMNVWNGSAYESKTCQLLASPKVVRVSTSVLEVQMKFKAY